MKRVIGVVMAVMVTTASAALADTNDGSITYQIGGSFNGLTVLDQGQYGYVGPYDYTLTGNNPNVPSNNNVLTGFCLDLITFVGGQQVPSTLWELDGTGTIPQTYQNETNLDNADSKVIRLIGYYLHNSGSLPPNGVTDAEGIALQMALWEVINGPTNGGSFTTDSATFGGSTSILSEAASLGGVYTGTVKGLADWLAKHYTDENYYATSGVYALVPGTDTQIQGIVLDGAKVTDVPPAPEPTGLTALASLGLCGLPIGMVWRRSRRCRKVE